MRSTGRGRSTSLLPLALVACAAGCAETETAIEVTFDVTGPRADEGGRVEVSLACEDGRGEAVRQSFDLRGLGEDVAPTLAIEPPSEEACDFTLETQLLGAASAGMAWPLASARQSLAYAEGAVRRVTVLLDTGGCASDVDGDGAAAGGGCEPPLDCDDLDADERVGAEEACDGKDNDCDGEVDDLAPFGDPGCPEDGTALVVSFEVTGEGAEAAEMVEAAFGCEGGGRRREEVLLGGGPAALAIHPPGGEACDLALSAQALGPADEAGVRWPLASASAELAFTPAEVTRETVTLETETCTDLDGDLLPVGAGAGEGCAEPPADCDDLEAGVYAGAVEQCNDRDDDCDGEADERPDLGPWCEVGETFALAAFRLAGDGVRAGERIEVAYGPVEGGAALERLDIDLDAPAPGDRVVLSLPGDDEDGSERVLLAQLRGPVPPEGEVDWPLASAGRRFAFVPGEVVRLDVRLDAEACTDADGDGSQAGPGGEEGCAGARDCDDLEPAVHLGADERCDGDDTDCNGLVDDLSDPVIAEACPAWNPNFGLCRLEGVAPRCDGDLLACPAWLASGRDDCDLYLDTTCDGRVSGCGCNTAGVSCPACYEAACSGEDTVCEPREAEDFVVVGELDVGEGCHPRTMPACPGTIACDGEPERLVCSHPTGGAELCNDGAGVDEDCDGLVDLDEADCRTLNEISRTCSALVLPRPRTFVGPIPVPCTSEYDGAVCRLRNDDGEGLESDAPLVVAIAVPPGVSLEVTGSSCCRCGFAVSSAPGAALIEIDPSGASLYVERDAELEIDVSFYLHRAGAAVAVLEDQPLLVDVDLVDAGGITPETDHAVCTSTCGASVL